ncbi:hypothetical protein I312_100978 [Cryptococcus bacillisporus CA1280]|uniref:carnosine N-methyltransferase n=1 Tax=Cryptococcus bacillisporus CA1280 TaxID=1296109 RepID=A0A0D0VK31_CRYGA|nr:hypothetical protein I312_05613 [Cryptococcus bacillisporus CA1280]
MSTSAAEKEHWRSVLRAFDGYMRYHLSANHARRMAFMTLPKAEKEVYELIGYREKLEAVDEGIRRNSDFIDEMIANPVFSDMISNSEGSRRAPGDYMHSHVDSPLHDHSHSVSPAHSHSQSSSKSQSSKTEGKRSPELDAAQDKVRSTLRSFVRDWTREGDDERNACYAPCLEALERYFPQKRDTGEKAVEIMTDEEDVKLCRKTRERSEVKVLVPGCGLGRLAMEIAARGFFSQGNEFSTYMLIASDWVLNQTTTAESHAIFPFLHSFSNHPTTEHHLLRSVRIPDVCPVDIFSRGRPGPFSLVAGDFEEIYGANNWDLDGGKQHDFEDGENHQGQWGAVVTCFFIDCARNVLNYLRIIHSLLADDGVWINVGPLLWHFENSPTTSAKGEGSVELSLDEVKELARRIGFDLREEKMIRSTYTGIPEGMLRHEYNAAFWVATKRREE